MTRMVMCARTPFFLTTSVQAVCFCIVFLDHVKYLQIHATGATSTLTDWHTQKIHACSEVGCRPIISTCMVSQSLAHQPSRASAKPAFSRFFWSIWVAVSPVESHPIENISRFHAYARKNNMWILDWSQIAPVGVSEPSSRQFPEHQTWLPPHPPVSDR